MAEFLAAHQSVAAPLIEWGGLFVLLFIILSPFLIIRHSHFKPTRWWHVVGAYVASFVILAGYTWITSVSDRWLIQNIFTSWELYGAYGWLDLHLFLNLLWLYPLLVFYCANVMYEHWNKKVFALSFLFCVLLGLILVLSVIYITFYGLGQLGMDRF